METLTLNGRTYTESETLLNKKVIRKNDNSLFIPEYILVDDFYTQHGVRIARIVLTENIMKYRSGEGWKKYSEVELYDKLKEI